MVRYILHCTTIYICTSTYINIFICTVHKYVNVCTSFITWVDSKCWVPHTHVQTYVHAYLDLSIVSCQMHQQKKTLHTDTCTYAHQSVQRMLCTYAAHTCTYAPARMHTCTPTDTQTHSENVDNVQCTHFFGPICMQQQLWTKWGLLSLTMWDTQFSGSSSKLNENPANVSTVMVRSSSRWRRPEEDNSIPVET